MISVLYCVMGLSNGNVCCFAVSSYSASIPSSFDKVSGADGLTSMPALSKEKNESCLTHQCYPSPLATVMGLATSMREYWLPLWLSL